MTLKRLLLVLSMGLLGLWALTIVSASPVSAALPPRPTPGSPPVVITGQTGQGASIELHVPAAQARWWTAVQWQDAQKNWHTVTGWQGSFDEIKSGVGSKLWWVAPGDFGTGPFRWAIYSAPSGQLLAASEAFNLPNRSKVKAVITVAVP